MPGHSPSPVVRADCKFFGTPPHFCVDVRFASPGDLDALIGALCRLRDRAAGESDHLHLQDHSAAAGGPQVDAEVTFWQPGLARDPTAEDCVQQAAAVLAALPSVAQPGA